MGEAITTSERSDVPSAAFDYAAWDRAVAEEGRSIAERVRQRTRAFVIDTGRDLVAIKGKLEHGQFTAWVEAALGITPRTAQNYMAAAEAFGAKSEIVSHLPPATIYKLATAPEPVRASVLKRMEAGEAIRLDAIAEEVKAAREVDRERRAGEREAARRAALTDEERAAEDTRTKRSVRSRAARERQEEAQREEWRQEREARKASVEEAAAILLAAMGADRMAAFAARYRTSGGEIITRAGDMAQVERARSQPLVKIMADAFERSPGWPWPSDEERERTKALAQEIQRDGLLEPLLVQLSQDRRGRYRILDGARRYRALTEVLHTRAIPARVAPPCIVESTEEAAA